MKDLRWACSTVIIGCLMVNLAVGQEELDRENMGEGRRGGGRGDHFAGREHMQKPGGRRGGGEHGGLEALGRMQGVGEDRILSMILRSPEMAEELNITEEEIEELREAAYDYKLDIVDIESALKKIQLQHGQEWLKAEPNEETLLTQIQEAGELEIKKNKRRAQYLLVLKRSFTPERMKKVRALMRKHIQERMQQWTEGNRRRGDDGDNWQRRRGGGGGDRAGGQDHKRGGKWKGKEDNKAEAADDDAEKED